MKQQMARRGHAPILFAVVNKSKLEPKRRTPISRLAPVTTTQKVQEPRSKTCDRFDRQGMSPGTPTNPIIPTWFSFRESSKPAATDARTRTFSSPHRSKKKTTPLDPRCEAPDAQSVGVPPLQDLGLKPKAQVGLAPSKAVCSTHVQKSPSLR